MPLVLVLSNLRDVTMSYEWSLDRERILRLTGAALAREASIDGIGVIVRMAVRDLIGQQPNCEGLFAMRDDDELTVVARSSGDMTSSSEFTGLVRHWLPRMRLLDSDEPRVVPAARLDPKERAAADRAGFESVLLCPLVVTNRPSGDPLIGVLAVLGGHQMLSDLSSAVGILANQTALALERITLSEEVVRQRGEALFRTLVQDALDVILVLDDDMIIKYASPSASRLYGDIPIEGAKVDTLAADFEQVTPETGAGPARSEAGYRGLWQITRHDGQRLLVEAWISDLRNDETVKGQVLTVRDVTEENKLEDQLKYQAYHDTLTGLPNRALFIDRAEHALAMARSNKTTAAVLFVDLDDFKVVNDSMGHAVGDELLARVAKRLMEVRRKSDTACRLGGDEFALLIEGVQDPAAVDRFADRVVRAFSEAFELSAGPVLATITVGVATTEDSSDVGELLRHADLSLYAAKSEGKRRWRRYTPALSAGIHKRREMQRNLEDSLAKSELALAYQPIVEIATGEVRGFEALVRWPRPVEGITIQPAEFIELAEETGLIVPLGSWVLNHALTDMARLRGTEADPGPGPPYISVNVSVRQFRDRGFADGLRRCLDETGILSSAVVLELTESSLLRRDEQVTAALAELKDLGVRLAMDDFGTGYASPSSVLELPIDVLKIDKSFVDALAKPRGRKFAESIISFARASDVEVIAEGIETEEQLTLLTEMGCQLGQGFLLAKPMDWHAAEKLLLSGQTLPPEAPRHDSSR